MYGVAYPQLTEGLLYSITSTPCTPSLSCLCSMHTGAYVNARDHRKRTPLHVAAEKGEEVVVTFLLDKKADTNVTDVDRNTPLDLAARKLNQSAVNILLEQSHSSKKDEAVKKTLEKAMESDTVKDDLVGRKFGQLSPLRYCTSPWINVSRQLFHLLSRSL